MRTILATVAITAMVGFAGTASAHWHGNVIDPPGYPWAACSAPYGCASPLYTRRLIGHSRVVIRHHHARLAHHSLKHAVHRTWKPRHHLHAAYAARGFQYIDDPQLAAVLAWGDIVNSGPR